MEHSDTISKLPDFLVNMLEEQYSKENIEKILKGFTTKRVVSFRINTLKTNLDEVLNILNMKGINYELVPWSELAVIINDGRKKDIQELDIYKEGKIYLQSLSSMLPPIILSPKPNADILDMAAAPGGKTTQIAALSANKSHITACEVNAIRAKRLKYNIEKQGATCVYCILKDARNIDDCFSFDQILLDTPCSGSGTLNINDENINNTFTMKLVNKSKRLQLALLKKAITILKPRSEMVYSTCSILSCENEEILNQVIDGNKYEIVPIEFNGKESIPILPTRIDGTICVCPNNLYEGFFVAKIRKNY